jgi:hypothetical protein
MCRWIESSCCPSRHYLTRRNSHCQGVRDAANVGWLQPVWCWRYLPIALSPGGRPVRGSARLRRSCCRYPGHRCLADGQGRACHSLTTAQGDATTGRVDAIDAREYRTGLAVRAEAGMAARRSRPDVARARTDCAGIWRFVYWLCDSAGSMDSLPVCSDNNC